MQCERNVLGTSGAFEFQRIAENLECWLQCFLAEEDHVALFRCWAAEELGESVHQARPFSLQPWHVGKHGHGKRGGRLRLWCEDGPGAASRQGLLCQVASKEV